MSSLTDQQHDLSTEENTIDVSSSQIGDYLLCETIGKGTFGKVKLGVHIPTQEKVAIKILEKRMIQGASDYDSVRSEIDILKRVHHPNISQLYQFSIVFQTLSLPQKIIETDECLYLILEYAEKGELFELIVRKKRYIYLLLLSDLEACLVLAQVLNALEYLQSMDICHRDLKPENLLFNSEYELKIVDFGLSKMSNQNGEDHLFTCCGSPCYASPETISLIPYVGKYVDMWSCGIILFAMVCGYLPFDDDNQTELFSKIVRCEFYIPNEVSPQVAEVIRGLLKKEPTHRMSIEQIKSSDFYVTQMQGALLRPGIRLGVDPIIIDEEIINYMKECAFDSQETRSSILSNAHNNLTVTYYLLKSKQDRILSNTQNENQEDTPKQIQPTVTVENDTNCNLEVDLSPTHKKNQSEEIKGLETYQSQPKQPLKQEMICNRKDQIRLETSHITRAIDTLSKRRMIGFQTNGSAPTIINDIDTIEANIFKVHVRKLSKDKKQMTDQINEKNKQQSNQMKPIVFVPNRQKDYSQNHSRMERSIEIFDSFKVNPNKSLIQIRRSVESAKNNQMVTSPKNNQMISSNKNNQMVSSPKNNQMVSSPKNNQIVNKIILENPNNKEILSVQQILSGGYPSNTSHRQSDKPFSSGLSSKISSSLFQNKSPKASSSIKNKEVSTKLGRIPFNNILSSQKSDRKNNIYSRNMSKKSNQLQFLFNNGSSSQNTSENTQISTKSHSLQFNPQFLAQLNLKSNPNNSFSQFIPKYVNPDNKVNSSILNSSINHPIDEYIQPSSSSLIQIVQDNQPNKLDTKDSKSRTNLSVSSPIKKYISPTNSNQTIKISGGEYNSLIRKSTSSIPSEANLQSHAKIKLNLIINPNILPSRYGLNSSCKTRPQKPETNEIECSINRTYLLYFYQTFYHLSYNKSTQRIPIISYKNQINTLIIQCKYLFIRQGRESNYLIRYFPQISNNLNFLFV